ncbi:uncharacterized protein [Dermacentor albipictus]|uniref:uncharacterized protein n=1 Tax=Dermacentor albipictus TaxID=60249 RepID=UPI0031FC8882
MDRPKRGAAKATSPLSKTSLSQDTDHILCSWHRFVRLRDLDELRAATDQRKWRLGQRAGPLATSQRDAALRYLSAYPYPADEALSSQCGTDNSDESQVPVGQSLCYALLVVLTGVVALSTGVVLVRLVPAATNSSKSFLVRNVGAPSEFLQMGSRPSPKAKSSAIAAAPARPSGLLRAAPSVVGETKALQSTTRTTSVNAASANSDTRKQEHGMRTEPMTGLLFKESESNGDEDGSEEKIHLCDLAFFTYCPRIQHQFYFNRITNSCARATMSYGVEVCNRGANRFSSRVSCKRSCVDSHQPSGRCQDTPVFSQCGSADLKRRLWFFEGEACRPWDFPSGKCPTADGDLFRSHGACVRKCATNKTYVPLCRTPPSGVCAGQRLKYPYFAVQAPGETKMRCLRTSGLSLRKRLCLTGTNRFPSLASCKRACASGASFESRD